MKLIATDLDGTFLRPDHSFDREGLRALLQRFKEKDYVFVAASGRPLVSIQQVFEGFEEEVAFVAENGSIVSYKGQVIFEAEPIAKDVYLPIVEGIRQSPYANQVVVLSGREGAYLLEEDRHDYFDFIAQYYLNLQTVDDFAAVEEDIIKLVATFEEDQFDEAQNWINQTFPDVVAVTTGFCSVDIILSGSHKAVGLSKLGEALGVQREDILAFGDNQNDLEMLDFAGHAVAPSNARPEVLAVVDEVIGDCGSDAVLRYMEGLV